MDKDKIQNLVRACEYGKENPENFAKELAKILGSPNEVSIKLYSAMLNAKKIDK